MPAHQVYVTLIDIWSHGCNPMLRYSLPVLFAFEVSSFILSALGIYRRSHYAIIRAEAEAHALHERVDFAITFEKNKRAKEKIVLANAKDEGDTEQVAEADNAQISDGRNVEDNDAVDDEKEREDIESLINEDADRLRQLPSVNLGPSFGFGLGERDTRRAE
jgi:hypothetical protein